MLNALQGGGNGVMESYTTIRLCLFIEELADIVHKKTNPPAFFVRRRSFQIAYGSSLFSRYHTEVRSGYRITLERPRTSTMGPLSGLLRMITG